MQEMQPLIISTGQPADGENKFFPRDKIIKKIWDKLERGEDILLTAPRRVGKSSILHYIKKNPHEGYIVKYLSVMGIDDANLFFKQIYTTLLENDEIYGLTRNYFEKSKTNIKDLIKRLRSFGIDGIELDGKEHIVYYEEIIKLLKSLPKETKKVVFLFDEFPEVVSNIARHNKNDAIKFLQDTRDLRQLNHDADIQFVITGSIGLKQVVRQLTNDSNLTNDLTSIEIPPLNNEEASHLIDRVCLGLKEQKYPELIFPKDVKSYLFKKVAQNIPYYLMMIVDKLSEDIDEPKTVTKDDIDATIDRIIKSQASDYFSNWKERLTDAFEEKERKVAIEILSLISKENSINYDKMKKINNQIDLKAIIEILEYDGYISEQNGAYSFLSPLLKAWWRYRVAE